MKTIKEKSVKDHFDDIKQEAYDYPLGTVIYIIVFLMIVGISLSALFN